MPRQSLLPSRCGIMPPGCWLSSPYPCPAHSSLCSLPCGTPRRSCGGRAAGTRGLGDRRADAQPGSPPRPGGGGQSDPLVYLLVFVWRVKAARGISTPIKSRPGHFLFSSTGTCGGKLGAHGSLGLRPGAVLAAPSPAGPHLSSCRRSPGH